MSEPTTTDPRLGSAYDAANNGEFARAEQLLHEVLSTEAMPAESLSNYDDRLLALDLLGFVQYFQGRPGEAEQACRRALAIEPNRAYSNKGLGLCLAKQGKLDDGLPYLRRAIALAPEWFDPRWDTAIVLVEACRYDEALAVLDEAVRAVPAERARFEQLRDEVRGRRSNQPTT